jgi:hypothetical protein
MTDSSWVDVLWEKTEKKLYNTAPILQMIPTLLSSIHLKGIMAENTYVTSLWSMEIIIS